ncbi:MAG: YigZ family protein [Ferruginibacter sp.]
MKTQYYTVARDSQAEFKDRGSRFLAFVFPVQNAAEVKNHLQSLKKEHAKAVHHCYAYRLGIDENIFRAVDDGEPSGTAGKPILGQIDSRNLTNVCIFVVRYFGGTLLGVPGLINAYKTAASLALQIVPVVSRPVMKSYVLEFNYTIMNTVMHILRKNNAEISTQNMQLFCTLEASIPVNNNISFLEEVSNIPEIDLKIPG